MAFNKVIIAVIINPRPAEVPGLPLFAEEVFDLPPSYSARGLARDSPQAAFESSSNIIKKLLWSFLGSDQRSGHYRSTKVYFIRFRLFFQTLLLVN